MLVRVRVKPNSKSDSINIGSDGIIGIRIHAQPVDGKANKYLVDYIARVFNLSRSCIEIVKGHNGPDKTIKLDARETYLKNIMDSFKGK